MQLFPNTKAFVTIYVTFVGRGHLLPWIEASCLVARFVLILLLSIFPVWRHIRLFPILDQIFLSKRWNFRHANLFLQSFIWIVHKSCPTHNNCVHILVRARWCEAEMSPLELKPDTINLINETMLSQSHTNKVFTSKY